MFKFPSCPLVPGSTVWLYLRDSGGDNQDLSSQRAFVLAYCQHYKLQIIREFEDSAISGGSTAGRDDFQAMIEMAHSSKKPLVDALLYWDTKRFARNQLDSQYYKADLRRRGYRLLSLSDDIPDNELSGVFEAFLEWKAQKDREDLSKDIRRGMSHIVALKGADGNYLGIFPGAAPTFFAGIKFDTGLKRNDGSPRIIQRLVPDSQMWPLGQEMWRMRAERASYLDIERTLRIFPNNGNPSSAYYHIFRNEIYIGRLHYSGQVYDNFVPRLATPEQWERVQALNYSRPQAKTSFPSDKIHPKAGRGDFLLSGLCKCAYCEANIHGSTNRRRERSTAWRYYICSTKDKWPEECRESKRIPARVIEDSFMELILDRVMTPAYVESLADRINFFMGNGDTIQVEIEHQQHRLSEVSRAIHSLMDAIELSPSTDLLTRLKQRQAERDALERQLQLLQNRIVVQQHLVNKDTILGTLAKMRLVFASDEIKPKQLILQSSVSKIELGRSVGYIYYRFPTEVLLERVNSIELNPLQIYEFSY